MARIKAFIFVVFSFNLAAQQFDTSFLESLPDNIAADFQSQSKILDEDDEKAIQSPDTRIKNLEASLEEAERILEGLQFEMDTEEFLNGNIDLFKLERFGKNFFNSYQSSFLPINEPSANPNYILDIDDELTIQIVGQKNLLNETKILRDGSISIPGVGNLVVAGLPFSEAVNLIKAKIGSALTGSESFITLSSVRDINALIVGGVEKPGMYTLPGGSTPLSLVNVAGGINEGGTYRKLLHKRNNEVLQEIDLYDVFINGNLSFKHQLRSGDSIVVDNKLSEVRVSGSFAKPAIYEFLPDENLEDILTMAGIRKIHSSHHIEISRLKDGVFKTESLPIVEASNYSLFDGDSIKLSAVDPKFKRSIKVTVSGEVNVPGTYYVDEGTRLSGLLRKAGMYTDNAFIEGGVFTRRSVREAEKVSNERSYNELIRFIVASNEFSSKMQSSDASGIITFLSLLKEYQPTGRIITEFNLTALERDPTKDRILHDGDSIHIPAFENEVYVFGEVMMPGAMEYNELNNFKDYILSAGSLSRVADSGRVIIINPNGSVRNVSLGSFKFFEEKGYILPGSTIYVPREVGKIDGIKLAGVVAPILSSFALSVASLNSIN